MDESRELVKVGKNTQMHFQGELPSKTEIEASIGLLLESIDCLARTRVFLAVYLCYMCKGKKKGFKSEQGVSCKE